MIVGRAKACKRSWLVRDQGGLCFYCACELVDRVYTNSHPPHGNDATIEHVQSRAFGGSNGPENLVAACAFCNALMAKVETWCAKTFGPRRVA